MISTVRSGRFEPPMPFLRPPAAMDKEFGLDEDVGPDEPHLALDTMSEGEPRSLRPVRAVALWLSMAVLGVILAFVWRYVGAPLWPDTQGWLAFAAGSTSTGSNRAEDQFGRIVGELDALKKKIDELNVSQQQTAAQVTSLQTAQQELQRRVSSSQGARWYSNFDVLNYPIPAARKSAAAPKQTPTARAPSEAQDGNVGRRNDGEPLSLISPGR
jgi:TolA-binding protein